MPTALVLEGLRKVFPDGTVGLDGVSLTVPGGEAVAVLGRSGAGQSTLLRCASRLIEPTAGLARIGDTELTAMKGLALARARGRIGFVFQQFNLIKSHTALENVLVARLGHVSYLRGLLGLWRPEDIALASRCLDEVGLTEKHHSAARDLSGGQQQRVAVARAFAQEPDAIFADEPTASLDPHLAATVLAMLRDYAKRRAVPLLVNVHTVAHARRYFDRVVGMRAGKIVHDGPASELTDAEVNAIYGVAQGEETAL